MNEQDRQDESLELLDAIENGFDLTEYLEQVSENEQMPS